MTPAADCHVHIFDPTRYPLRTNTKYTPLPNECGRIEDLNAILATHGFTHALLVQPASGYDDDNRYLLEVLGQARGRFRGICRVKPGVARAKLEAMQRMGVVGLRIDMVGDGTSALDRGLLEIADALGWILQIQCERDQLAEVDLGVFKGPIVVDHLGRPDPEGRLAQRGFQALLELGRSGRGYVKLSGAFRFSLERWPYLDADPFAAALLEAFTPARCVWGSDWPFIGIGARTDYNPTLACLARWVPDDRARGEILWTTPNRLYRFV